MKPQVSVFIAMSLDGFIATKDNGLDWLKAVEREGEDYGYQKFFDTVDVLLMGRNTYDIVRNFPEWIYKNKKVIVLSHRPIQPIATEIQMSGPLSSILETLGNQGIRKVYLDGGNLIRQGLQEGLVDNLTISVIPVLLGSGITLFGEIGKSVELKTLESRSFPSGLVQINYAVKASGEKPS